MSKIETPNSSDLVSQSWALKLVAKWCDKRAAMSEERRLVERCRRAYKNGPMVGPVARFADELEKQLKADAEGWRGLAFELREDAATKDEQPLTNTHNAD